MDENYETVIKSMASVEGTVLKYKTLWGFVQSFPVAASMYILCRADTLVQDLSALESAALSDDAKVIVLDGAPIEGNGLKDDLPWISQFLELAKKLNVKDLTAIHGLFLGAFYSEDTITQLREYPDDLFKDTALDELWRKFKTPLETTEVLSSEENAEPCKRSPSPSGSDTVRKRAREDDNDENRDRKIPRLSEE
jgi:hypothetical protein